MEFAGGTFDAVLLDAPCSATGTIRRHPEIAWTKTLSDILALASQQARMLDAASKLVKAGGFLVYSTCSLEREEGEDPVERFLEQRPDFQRVPISPGESDIRGEMITSAGDLRALPCHLAEWGGADGFLRRGCNGWRDRPKLPNRQRNSFRGKVWSSWWRVRCGPACD